MTILQYRSSGAGGASREMLLLADSTLIAAVQLNNGAETIILDILGVNIPANADGAWIIAYAAFSQDEVTPATLFGDIFIDGNPLIPAFLGNNFLLTLPQIGTGGMTQPRAMIALSGVFPGIGLHDISLRTTDSTVVGTAGDGVRASRAGIQVFSIHTAP